jgi:Ca2+-binding RTX toxin-like protein
MAQYRFDPIWNSYVLEPETETFSLAAVDEHGDADAGVTGNSRDNVITGDAKNNNLDGGQGADTLTGGLGNDAYSVDNAGDVVIERPGEGEDDSVIAFMSYALPDEVEDLILRGIAPIDGTGNALNNDIIGNDSDNFLQGKAGDDRLFGYDGDDILDGGEGADSLVGWTGNDTFIVDNPGDTVFEDADQGEDWVIASVSYTLGNNLEHLHLVSLQGLTGIGNDLDNRIIGDLGDDVLEGHDGNDTLEGRTGADTLRGGAGDDVYQIDSLDDVVEEEDGGGIDRVETTISLTLAVFVESLMAVGFEPIALTGNALNNLIQGNSAANTLDGGAGADTLEGGAGDDVYRVDDAGDIIIEIEDGGTDWIEAAFDVTLGDHVEHLRLMGSQALAGRGNGLANQLIGALGNDTLEAREGNDTLDGGAGADRLEGGAGDDLYRVDDAGDVVVELDREGIDRVETSVSHALAAFIENLVAIGSGAITLTGNALDNTLTGNAAANVLDGSAGADTMIGGAGDDTYVTDGTDIVIEQAGDGIDTIITAASYTLAAHLENVKATGSAAISLGGNAVDNLIQGNAAANTLDGGAGADTLSGGGGDDTYIADFADTIIELAGGGTDTVQSAFSHRLGDHLENLIATGSSAVILTGNASDNRLTGNAAANLIDGGLGADIMDGGAGDDTLIIDNAGDAVSGGSGTDRVETSISFALGSDVENLAAAAGIAALSLTGNAFGNSIVGNSGANRISGGLGNDVLNGGAGKDTFVFDSKPHAKTNRDIITDFTLKQDRIWLENKIFKKLGTKGTEKKPFKLAKDSFALDKAKDADDYLVYISKAGKILYDADGSGRGKAVEFAQVKKGLALTFKDFFVI